MLSTPVLAAMDRFNADMLTAFNVTDWKEDEEGMRAAGYSEAKGSGDWETAKVEAERGKFFMSRGGGIRSRTLRESSRMFLLSMSC